MSAERLSQLAEEQVADQPAPTPVPQAQCDSAMLELVRRRRDELRAELRQIQDGERPVTGAESRKRVDRFFSRRLDVRQSEERRGVVNEDDVDEHRPEQVTIEVQGLLQRRSVSSFLSSSRFRRSLENSIRHGISGAISSRTQAQASQPRSTPTSNTATSTTGLSQTREPSSSNSSRLPMVPEATPAAALTHEVLRNETQPIERSNEEAFRQLQHEDFVMEISELVHRQIVSNTLNTETIRRRLENVARAGVTHAGEDASRRSQEALSQLPPSRIARNDFSHLGIQSGVDNIGDLDDAVSVISATASATIPYAQTSHAVNREITTLKSQIAELTNLVKMSLNVQADIQRSIRQEVSAAVNQQHVNTGPTQITGLQSHLDAKSKCLICLDTLADSVLYRCGHLCTCFNCASRLKEDQGQTRGCPVCRAPIVDIMRVYRIQAE